MTAAASSRGASGRAGWVEFPQERLVNGAERHADVSSGSQRPAPTDTPSSSIEPVAPPPQHNAWVLFDEKPWPSPNPHTQGKGPRTSICSTASFWSAVLPSEHSWTTQSEQSSVSWATQSEQSSVSLGASSCDLPSLNTEEPHNETPSRPQSLNSSVFPEDEGIDMDSISWTSNARNTNGQSETTTSTNGQSETTTSTNGQSETTTSTNGQSESTSSTNRFSAWVTFDEDDERSHRPRQRPEKPAHITLDIRGHAPLQDANSNLIGSPTRKQKQNQNGSYERHLLDTTPDCSGTIDGFGSLLQNSAPYRKKNPFLDEEFNDIQPSPINPFSSYFDSKQEVRSPTEGNGAHLESPPSAFSFSSPFFQSHAPPPSERDSILLFSSEFDPSGEGEGGERGGGGQRSGSDCPTADRLVLNQLRNLHIPDPDDPGSPTLPDDPLEEEEEEEWAREEEEESPPYRPDHMTPREGWPMLLRIPEKKNIMSSRHWGPIYVRLSSSDDPGPAALQLFYERGLDKPFRTLPLDPRHEASEHRLQSYEDAGRVHTLSLDLVRYREARRRLQPIRSPVTGVAHQPIREQLVKLGTTCYHDYLSFRHALVEMLRGLPSSAGVAAGSPSPTTPIGGGGASDEEVQVEVRDEFYGTVGAGDGRVLRRRVVTRVHVLAFLSGDPVCRLGLNDVQVKGKEVVSRHDIIPNTTPRWIRLLHPQLHGELADGPAFRSARTVSFTAPPRRRFQLLRFTTAFAHRTLPFTLRTVACVRGAEVTLQSWLVMSPGFSSNRDALNVIPCENVAVRYPIPEIWAKNFRREGVTGERSLKARFNKGASLGSASAPGAEPVMRVTLGSAKYEPAFRAVVWRISRLPDKNSALGHPHTFFCRLELGSDREVPESLQRHLEVEFDMPAASASSATVRSLSVGDRTDVRKWINYKAHYHYQVPIEQKRGSVSEGSATQQQPGEQAQPGEPAQQQSGGQGEPGGCAQQ